MRPVEYSVENVEGILDVMDPNALRNGQRGIAKHLIDEMFTTPDGDRRMICTDPSRDIFKYLNPEKVISRDCKLAQLIELCIEAGLQNKITEFIQGIRDQDLPSDEECILYRYATDCMSLRHSNADFRSEFREQLTV